MDYSSPYSFDTTSGATTLQPPPQPNAAGSAFAARFHELLMPLEELMAEWRVVCQRSPELAQETFSLLNHSGNLTETRYILLSIILSSIGAQPEYYPSPALHYEAQPSSQYCDFVPPSSPRTTFPPPPTYTPLQQQQPWIGMTLVDPPPPSIFTAILEETEEHSSARMMSGDGAALFDLSMPFFGGGGEAAEPFPTASPFLQLPTPLATPTTSTSHSPWSVHSTATSSSICASFPPNPILYSSPKSSLVAPSSAELAPLNTSPLYLLLLHSTTSSTPQLEVHELKILLSSSSDLGAERPILRLGWFEFEGDKEPLRVFDAIKREGEGEGEVWLELLGTEGGGESEGGRILFFDVGTYSVPAVDGEKGAPMIGSGEWWRAQVCWGHHPLSLPPTNTYWTPKTSPPGHKTRKHRVLAHFNGCTKGSCSVALRQLARIMAGAGRK